MNTTTSPKPDRTESTKSLKTVGILLLISGISMCLYIFSAGSPLQFLWVIAALIHFSCAGFQLKLVRLQRKSENLSVKVDALSAQPSASN